MKIYKRILSSIILLFICVSCEDEVTVKPAAQLRLDYPIPEYKMVDPNCAFSFEMNENAVIEKKENCALNIQYPRMKATIYMTYQQVRANNLDSLLQDAQRLAYDHTIKANSIPAYPFVNPDSKVYGMFYMINGNAATQAEFYVTDSIRHFVNGAVYFKAKPNYDSVYPAAEYLREDIRRIMETIVWE